MSTSVQPQPGVPAPAPAPGAAPPLQVLPQNPPGQGYSPANVPAAPAPAATPTPSPIASPTPQPAQQQPGPQGAVQVGPQTVLSGPGVPQHLQGRTLGEAMQIMEALRGHYLQTANQPPVQPQQPQAPATTAAQPAAGATAQDFYRDPIGHTERAAERAVQRALAPLLQRDQTASFQQTVAEVAREFGNDWNQIQPLVAASLQGATPEQLANPELIRTAAYVAETRLRRMGQLGTPQPRSNGAPQPGGYPPQSVPAGVQPLPNLPGYFSEAPTPPSVQGNSGLAPFELDIAGKMGMSPEQYSAWKGGVGR